MTCYIPQKNGDCLFTVQQTAKSPNYHYVSGCGYSLITDGHNLAIILAVAIAIIFAISTIKHR